MDRIRVLIADDHALLRQGLRQILEMEKDMDIVGEASTGNEVLKLHKQLSPDVILLDISMPGISGVEVAKEIKKEKGETGIVMLTIHDSEEYLFEAIKAGVNGYVLKDVDPEILIEVIRSCKAGSTYLHPQVTGKVIDKLNRLSDMAQGHAQGNPALEVLTERELDVLRLMAEGAGNKEIANKLYISEKTVKNHATNIFRKLDVADRTQAVIEALKRGWVKIG